MCCGTWPRLVLCLVMDFSYGFRAQVLGGLGPFFLLVLIPCFYVFVPFFFKRKTGPKKNGGGGTGCFPVLVWFSPGNRPPFRPLSEYGGPEGLLGSGFEFLRWRFCCGRGVCKWGVLRWMWFSFFRLGDWPAFWRGLGPSILICGDRMGGAGRRVSGDWMGASPLRGIGPVAVSLKKASFEPAPNGLVRRTLSRRME